MKVAHAVAAQTNAGALVSVAGGGDTVFALGMAGTVDQMTYGGSCRRCLSGMDGGQGTARRQGIGAIISLSRLLVCA